MAYIVYYVKSLNHEIVLKTCNISLSSIKTYIYVSKIHVYHDLSYIFTYLHIYWGPFGLFCATLIDNNIHFDKSITISDLFIMK